MNFLNSQMTQGAIYMYLAVQLFSALVQSLPNPTEILNSKGTPNVWYKSLYNFLTIASTDFKSFFKAPSTIATETSGAQISTLRTAENGEKSLTESTIGPSSTVITTKGV